MFKEATDLELALIYRALNTERNIVIRHNRDGRMNDQVFALNNLLAEYEVEEERRYVARIAEKVDTGK